MAMKERILTFCLPSGVSISRVLPSNGPGINFSSISFTRSIITISLNWLSCSYSSVKRVDNLYEVARSREVMKISVWDSQPCAEHGGVILPPLIDGLRTMISGYDWLDVSAPCANKGRAFDALLSYFGAERSESIAFGDHMNDYEMLCAAGKAYVTANAFPLLKQKIGEEIPSNAQYGVIQKLGELLK